MRILTFQDALSGTTVLVKADASGLNLCREFNGVGTPGASLGSDGDSYVDTDLGHVFVRLNGAWSRVTVPDPSADSLAKLREDFRSLLRACDESDHIVLPDLLQEQLFEG